MYAVCPAHLILDLITLTRTMNYAVPKFPFTLLFHTHKPQVLHFQTERSIYSDFCVLSVPFALHKSYSSARPVKPDTGLIIAFPFQSGKILTL